MTRAMSITVNSTTRLVVTDSDDLDEVMRNPKFARIVADLVTDVNLTVTHTPRRRSAEYLDSEIKETASQELG